MAKRAAHRVGLDLGTGTVACIVLEPNEATGLLEVIGIGRAESRGLRKGVVVNPDAAVDSIKRAVEEAERMSGIEADSVVLNLAGSHLKGQNGQAVVAISGRDREISSEDVKRAMDSACAIQLPAGREIVDRLAQEFIVDDQDGINDPVGMIGARLQVRVHIVTSPVTARQNAIDAVNRAGLRVADMVLDQLASAEATLTAKDKEYGAALVNIGAETTGLAIFQRGGVQHTAVFPLGGSHFTNDIAFGLRTPIPEAEKIKRSSGCVSSASLDESERSERIKVPSVGGRPSQEISKQILCDILQARAEEVLMHVAAEIKDTGWERQLSSGVVLTGGGALVNGMAEIAEQVFDAPARLGFPVREQLAGLVDDIQSPEWTTAVGLAMFAQRAQQSDARLSASRRAAGAGRLGKFFARIRNGSSGIF